MSAKIYFTNEDLEVEVEPGITFVELAQEVDCDITFGCRSGSCGTCRIRVVEGLEHLTPMNAEEKDFLQGFHAHPQERLACQCAIEGDCQITYVGLDDLDDVVPAAEKRP